MQNSLDVKKITQDQIEFNESFLNKISNEKEFLNFCQNS